MPDANAAIEATLARAGRIFTRVGGLPGLLAEADAELSQRLHKIVEKAGGPRARFSEAAALLYREQIRLTQGYMEQRFLGLTHDEALVAIEHSVRDTVALARRLENRFEGIAQPLALEAQAMQDAVVRGAGASLLQQHRSSVARYGTAMIADFERQLRLGALQGLSNHHVISRLVKVGELGGVNAAELHANEPNWFPEPTGFIKRRYWAERIVRTEKAYAYNAAGLRSIEGMRGDFPDMQKKILAQLDNRTAPDSIAVHGQVRPLDGLFRDGAGREYLHPPARPNDRETVIPWRPHWTDTEATASADKAEQAKQDAARPPEPPPEASSMVAWREKAQERKRRAEAKRREIAERAARKAAQRRAKEAQEEAAKAAEKARRKAKARAIDEKAKRAEQKGIAPDSALGTAKFLKLKYLGGGANDSQLATLVDGSGRALKAVWKPAAGEVRLRMGIRPGTYYRRESAVSKLDRMMGGTPVVPTTIVREHEGRIGSLQRFVDGALSSEEAGHPQFNDSHFRRPSVRRMILLDTMAGNDDRHPGNIMYVREGRRGLRAVGIDNGLTMPDGMPPTRVLVAGRSAEDVPGSPWDFSDERELLENLNLRSVAKMLQAEGIEKGAARGVLYRIERLKANPRALQEEVDQYGDSRGISEVVKGWSAAAESESVKELVNELW